MRAMQFDEARRTEGWAVRHRGGTSIARRASLEETRDRD
jgi:hypothetical protein